MFRYRHRYLWVLLLAVYSLVNTLYVEALVYYQLPVAEWELLAFFGTVILLIWEGNRLVELAVPRLQHWFGGKLHPLVLLFAGGILITALAVVPLTLGLAYGYHHWALDRVWLTLKLALTFAFRVNLFLHIINAMVYLLQREREAQLAAEQFKKASAQAQFASLRTQVNPHFLFNTLNVLSSLVQKDPLLANDFIEELAKVYRYVLQNFEKELVDLGSELAFIHSYVYLLEKRFHDGVRVEVNVPPAYLGHFVMPLALQMLVENAIKHNVSSKNRPLLVQISVDDTGYLCVRNNLQPKLEKEISTQLGLDNLDRRYKYIANRRIVKQVEPKHFVVKVPILELTEI
jgi:two-component system, LytTR family, sensor kinase